MKKKKNLKNLSEFIDDNFGKSGSERRDKFEKGYTDFKMGLLIQEARLQRGFTQEQVAKKCGTSKGYISKIENNIKDVRLSTLQKIVEIGLEGRLQLSIKL
jgi:DNA-binding XRE family transcriptional regulator